MPFLSLTVNLKALLIIFLSFLSVSKPGFAVSKEKPQLHIKKTSSEIIVDGIINEKAWQDANIAGDFFQSFPSDTTFAKTKTEVRITYDNNYIYISAICYDEIKGDYVVQSLKRDFSYPISDAFAVFIDTFDDKTNGFSFAVNPYGAQREGLLQGGAMRGVTTSWDNKWFSAVVRSEDKWVVEMAIPFKTIRYNESIKKWGINFSRNDLKRNENSSWSPVPRNFNIGALAYTGDLIWEEPPAKAGMNVSLIPYVIGGLNKDYTDDSPMGSGANIGADAKVAITSSLNLDLTINPDFSQVDVDQQQTNLTRFSLFFPEKRQFFIENSDLFAKVGFSQIRPFFSRNIGLQRINGAMQPVPIIAGARLSGKLNKNWRIGAMNIQTGKKEFKVNQDSLIYSTPENFTVAAIQRQLFGRSAITGIFVNRQNTGNTESTKPDYNRIIGLDLNLASSDNKWNGKAFVHKSISPSNNENSIANSTWVMYSTPKLFCMWNQEYVNGNYNAEVGFVPRNKTFNPVTKKYERRTYWRLEPFGEFNMYPKSKLILLHGPGVYFNYFFDSDLKTTDYNVRGSYKLQFINSARIDVQYEQKFTRLFYETDISNNGTSISSGDYRYNNSKIKFSSNKRKKLTFSGALGYGKYYIGTKISYNAELRYRLQPWGIISAKFNRDEIRLPVGYGNAFITLIGPKIELSFTKNLFFTTFFQFNTQADNININTRIQWRFKPMSDLFIVYTDNYDPVFKIKNRALVVKLVYWL